MLNWHLTAIKEWRDLGLSPRLPPASWDLLRGCYVPDGANVRAHNLLIDHRSQKSDIVDGWQGDTYRIPNTDFMLNYTEFIAQRIFHATGETVTPKRIREYLALYSLRLGCRCLSGNLQRGDALRFSLAEQLSPGLLQGLLPARSRYYAKAGILYATSFLTDPSGTPNTAGKQADSIATHVLTVEELYNWDFHHIRKKSGWRLDVEGYARVGVEAEILRARAALIDAKLARAGYYEVALQCRVSQNQEQYSFVSRPYVVELYRGWQMVDPLVRVLMGSLFSSCLALSLPSFFV